MNANNVLKKLGGIV
jgi:hypothetical protein